MVKKQRCAGARCEKRTERDTSPRKAMDDNGKQDPGGLKKRRNKQRNDEVYNAMAVWKSWNGSSNQTPKTQQTVSTPERRRWTNASGNRSSVPFSLNVKVLSVKERIEGGKINETNKTIASYRKRVQEAIDDEQSISRAKVCRTSSNKTRQGRDKQSHKQWNRACERERERI